MSVDPGIQNSHARSALKEFPHESFILAHAATQWKEDAEATLAGLKLLAVAQGGNHPEAEAIIDVDLSEHPELDLTHRDYCRRMEFRSKVIAQNKSNALKRQRIMLEAWTELYTLLKKCTEKTAPVLSRKLMTLCDMATTHSMPGGYYDGPRAWQLALGALRSAERTEADKDFYRTAERLQLASHLADGCRADEYSTKAMAFVQHIAPNLPQAYEQADISEYLINLEKSRDVECVKSFELYHKKNLDESEKNG